VRETADSLGIEFVNQPWTNARQGSTYPTAARQFFALSHVGAECVALSRWYELLVGGRSSAAFQAICSVLHALKMISTS